jgi:DNA-binding Lrp family transcriptional regulator
MVTAIVLIECEKGKIVPTAEALAQFEGVSEVYSVAGRTDLVAMIRVQDNDQLADIITSKMLLIPGIAKTETLIAFQVYSKHDLDAMFSIGFEGEMTARPFEKKKKKKGK